MDAKEKKQDETKTTNEKPVKIPLPFKKAVKFLLDTKPEDIEEAEDKEKQEKPSK